MKRQIFLGSVLAAAMAVGLGAQSQYPNQGSATQNESQQSKSSAVTVTGCLEPSSQAPSSSATGTTGTNPSSKTTNAQYMLTNVSIGSEGSSASSASSPSSSTGTTGTESSILLEGKNLSKHEGHKVQVKGHWAEGSSDYSSSGGSTAGSSASGTSGSGSSASGQSGMSSSSAGATRTLRVSSVKDIASSCSGH